MDKKPVLKVKTLGKLNISNSKMVFPQEKKRSAQVELLIIYLIMNRNNSITNAMLIDILWPEGSAGKPEGALRNLIYRARKELNNFYENEDCIKSKGRSYCWNQNIECRIDYEDMLKMARRVEQEQVPHRKYDRCLEMVSKYCGEFLPDFDENEWIKEKNNLLTTTCLEAIIKTIECLNENHMYEQIILLCNQPNGRQIMDTRLYEMKLYAYYKTGKTDLALSFYRQIVDYYYSKFGIGVSTRLKEIYQMIIDSAPTLQMNVSQLEESLGLEGNEDNTFYCDYDVFKNIYQVNLRSARRSTDLRILALVSLEDTSGSLEEKNLQEEAEILKMVIANCLRKNDVFTKFNATQFSIILASDDLEGAKQAINRIIEGYNEKKGCKSVEITFDLKKIQ